MTTGMQAQMLKVFKLLSMKAIEQQIEEAMLAGCYSLEFKINNDFKPGVTLPIGEIHYMQAVKLAHDGYTVQNSVHGVTVSGWACLTPFCTLEPEIEEE